MGADAEEKPSGEGGSQVGSKNSGSQELVEEEEEVPENTYMIRPNYEHKFKKALVKDVINKVVQKRLKDEGYSSENVGQWSQDISNQVKARVKELGFERYKIVVQCLIGEQRGQGANMACRCFWDSDTDNYIQEVYSNSSLFCITAVFGVFYY